MITAIVPCYNEQEVLPLFLDEIQKIAAYLSHQYGEILEVIFINDGSQDNTLTLLRQFSKNNSNIRYISFSRNFGKEAALLAGFRHANGDYIVVMDADLQHPPSMLEEMYLSLKEGSYDIAAARRVTRKGEPLLRSWFSKLFYHLINRISKAQFVEGASDFRMLSRKAVDSILQMGEYNRFSKGIFGWIGFQTKWIPYENVERVAGETKWSFWKLFLYSLEGIIGYSTAPLAISSLIGILFFVVAIIWMIFIIVDTVTNGSQTAGYPTLACLLLIVGGSIHFSLGIIGQYLAKTYLETKKRPIYLISEVDCVTSDNTGSIEYPVHQMK